MLILTNLKKFRAIPEFEPRHYAYRFELYAYFLPKNKAHYAYKRYAYKEKTCIGSLSKQ